MLLSMFWTMTGKTINWNQNGGAIDVFIVTVGLNDKYLDEQSNISFSVDSCPIIITHYDYRCYLDYADADACISVECEEG